MKCPHCEQPADSSQKNVWRPFCCERCKLIDLGDWLGEKHRISGEPALETDDENRLEG